MWPSAYHRVVWKGNDAEDVYQFTTSVMDIALWPIATALTLDFYVLTAKVLGVGGGILMAAAIGATALIFWFGYGFMIALVNAGVFRKPARIQRKSRKTTAWQKL
jgi:hypothetical protein